MHYPASAVESAPVNALPVAEMSLAVFFFVKITAISAISSIPPITSRMFSGRMLAADLALDLRGEHLDPSGHENTEDERNDCLDVDPLTHFMPQLSRRSAGVVLARPERKR